MTGYVDSSGQAPITGKAELYINNILQKLNWAKTADTSWYNDNDTSFTLSSGEQLAGLAALVNDGNDFSQKTIQLGQDIDLDNREWTPIGKSDKVFKGSFVGDGHTISNLKITSASDNTGLFGSVSAGEIKNLNIKKTDIKACENVGALAGSVAGNTTIKKCNVTEGRIQGNADVGGLVGSAGAGTILIKCSATGNTISAVESDASQSTPYAGSIIGNAMAPKTTLTHCTASDNAVTSYNDSCKGELVGGSEDNWLEGYDLADVFKDSETMTISNDEDYLRTFTLILDGNIDDTLNCHISNCVMPKLQNGNLDLRSEVIAVQFDTNDPVKLEAVEAGILERQLGIPVLTKRTEDTYIIDGNIIYLNYCGHALTFPAYQNEDKECRYDTDVNCPEGHTPYIKEMLENYIN